MRNQSPDRKFTRRTLTLAVSLAVPALSQVAAAQQPEAQRLEEIRVTAQREATNKAIEQYRDSDAIRNFIASDDLGQ